MLERHGRVGTEASRNSEVIHASLYYPPGSLRAKLCVAGKELLYRYCAENGVAHKLSGKLFVATQEAELAKLEGELRPSSPPALGRVRTAVNRSPTWAQPELDFFRPV